MLTLSNRLLILASFILALALSVLPLPSWAVWFRPDWVVLVLLYWLIALPQRVNIGSAWLLGLLLDVMNGSLLGEHAFSLLIIAYLAYKIHRQVRVFPLWQQAVCVLGLLLIYQAMLFWIQGIIGQVQDTRFWLSALTSMLLWPWLFIVLRDLRRHFRIY